MAPRSWRSVAVKLRGWKRWSGKYTGSKLEGNWDNSYCWACCAIYFGDQHKDLLPIHKP